MLGAIVGDIIGSYYEEFNAKSIEFDLFHPKSHYTDDSVMTLAVAKWILEGEMTKANLIRCMKIMGYRHLGAGYGRLFYCWLRSNTPMPYNSFGNGSAMRISPIGIYAKSLRETIDLAKTTAEVTHNHPEGIKGAQAIAAAIFMARHKTSKSEIKEYIERTFNYDLSRSISNIRKDYSFNSSCQLTVPESIIAYMEGDSFEQVIRLAISLGGDSDTIACMAGSIAACTYDIPQNIIEWCENKLPDDLKGVLTLFCQKYNC